MKKNKFRNKKLYNRNLDKFYTEKPHRILNSLLLYALPSNELDSTHYFLFLRLRKLLTLEIIQSDKVRKILISAFKSKRAYQFIKMLEEVELLELIFPSIYALIKVDGGHYHNETVYTHVMGALRALDETDLPWYVKLAALYHDCGKCKWEISDEGKRRFTNHAVTGAKLVESDLKRLKFSKDVISIVKTLVNYHMSHLNDRNTIHVHSLRRVKTAFDSKNIPFKYFFWIRYADNMGSAVKETNFMYYWGVYKRSIKALNPPHVPSVRDLNINGKDLINEFNLSEGKIIGVILKSLFNLYQLGKISNEREVLLEKGKELINEFAKKHKE